MGVCMKVMHEDAEKYGLIEGKKPFHVGLNIFTDKSQITTTGAAKSLSTVSTSIQIRS